MNRDRALGVALVFLAAAGYGSGPLFAKPIYAGDVDWLTMSVWRFTFAALASWLWIVALPAQRAALRGLSRRRVLILVLLGVFFIANSGTYYAGLETVSASLAALIVYIYPALVAVIAIRFGRRLEGRRAWAALALALAGVALAVGGIDPATAPPVFGLALVAASPIIYAVWIVLAARLGGERSSSSSASPPHEQESSAEVDPTHAAPTAAIMITATAVSWWVIGLAASRPVMPAQIPADAWFPLLAIGVVSTAVALQAFYAGARRIGAAQASLVSTVEPVYTIALASILLGETLTQIQVFGGALVMMGVVIAQTGRRNGG